MGQRLGWAGAIYWMALIGTGLAASPDQQLLDAAQSGDLSEFDDALSAGADVHSQRGVVAFLAAVSSQDKETALAMTKEFLDRGASVNAIALSVGLRRLFFRNRFWHDLPLRPYRRKI